VRGAWLKNSGSGAASENGAGTLCCGDRWGGEQVMLDGRRTGAGRVSCVTLATVAAEGVQLDCCGDM
jgi:hypothetical protein